MTKQEQLAEWINESDRIVFFGGAGVSTESNIPDFRSVDGLYHQKYDYPPEQILSHTFFFQNTSEFFRFYKDKILIENVKPNPAHIALANLEKQGKLQAVITQNIDGLHQMAGSRNVYELHGTVQKNTCVNCRKAYSLDETKKRIHLAKDYVPRCDCGGIIKPDVVLYEEGLDSHCIERSIQAIANADVFIIGGTSLAVHPAAGLIDYYRGNRLILINKTPTVKYTQPDLEINEPIGQTLSPWA